MMMLAAETSEVSSFKTGPQSQSPESNFYHFDEASRENLHHYIKEFEICI